MTPRIPSTALLLAALLAGCGQRTNTEAPTAPAAPAASTPASAPASAAQTGSIGPLPAGANDFTALVRKVGPSVVNVTTVQTVRGQPGLGLPPGHPLSDFFRRFGPQGGPPPEERSQGVGSGFVIDAEGHILTNAHVVADADEVTVRLADSKREYKARVVGSDRQTDVALLKVDAQGLPVAPIGHSAQLQPGEWVAAIGSPFGFANTITAGIVSATQRSLPDETYVPFIQTDVAVNPGNSGGPLLNMRGEVVGINSMIYSQSGGYMGISFAIPIDMAMEVAQQLRANGRVTRGRLGIGIQEVSEPLAQSFKLDGTRGALVTAVEPNSPAARAGLTPGDVILGFNGQAVADANALPRLVAGTKPGTEVPIEVWRNGAGTTLKATVAEAPNPQVAEANPAARSAAPKPTSVQLGIAVSELPPSARRALGVEYGLVVEGLQEGAARSGLRPGDVIVAVNGQRFASLEEFQKRVTQAPTGGSVALLVRRGEGSLFVAVPAGKG
ncbi:DegQ family serine endoprotease [Azohydromonas caseinilytica]|uniref:Probable periplasmic serine endoprotease DegP-like n=1 Tax=Azohydromonas caseinilytica TaxID=2728836 RepID=A0A848F4E0_9BURK|nr:DegQ family serine endoprotease [Azohydromonas caseinilytica]NML14937.1 DegQ family serine endoprotease [Azohydromonas caseinilytica]